jgi:orotate phosphoribosyltransferase
VVTKGGSVVQAIDGAESVGCSVAAVIVLIDRLEGGTDKIRSRVPNARYIPIFTIKDFLDIAEIEREWTKNADRLSTSEAQT